MLVDGVERSINDIDPAEIESFSVLKDASASACMVLEVLMVLSLLIPNVVLLQSHQ